MSSKKNSGEQSILEWVSAHDHDLAEAIKSAGLEGSLEPQNGNGVTFLVPEDKTFREKLLEMDDDIDKSELTQKLNSLIIPEFFGQLNDFQSRPVGNVLNARFKVNCEGGVTLKPAADFVNTAGRAVYIMTEGSPPITGGGYQRPSRTRRPQVRGGAESMYSPPSRPFRQELADRVEEEFNNCMLKDMCTSYHPYLANVVSLLNFLKRRHTDLYKKALFMIDYEPITTFFLLMEPYKECGSYFIPDAVLGGWNGMILCSNATEEYMGFFKEMGEESGAIISQADKARRRIMAISDAPQALSALQSVYKIFEAQNSIEGYKLPAEAKPSTEGLKFWQDEFRFVAHVALQELRSQPFTALAFREITDEFRHTRAGNNYKNEVSVINCNRSVNVRAERMFLLAFINSTALLYIPCPPQNVTKWGPPQPMLPNSSGVYNHNVSAFAALQEVKGMVYPGGVNSQAAEKEKLLKELYGN
jgi:hypothetical protein